MKARTRWPDGLILVVGGWLIISPWALAIANNAEASWTAWILGALIVAAAVWALAQPHSWLPGALAAVLGLAVLIAPWVVGFAATVPVAMHNSVAVGIIVPLLSAWSVAESRREVGLV